MLIQNKKNCLSPAIHEEIEHGIQMKFVISRSRTKEKIQKYCLYSNDEEELILCAFHNNNNNRYLVSTSSSNNFEKYIVGIFEKNENRLNFTGYRNEDDKGEFLPVIRIFYSTITQIPNAFLAPKELPPGFSFDLIGKYIDIVKNVSTKTKTQSENIFSIKMSMGNKICFCMNKRAEDEWEVCLEYPLTIFEGFCLSIANLLI